MTRESKQEPTQDAPTPPAPLPDHVPTTTPPPPPRESQRPSDPPPPFSPAIQWLRGEWGGILGWALAVFLLFLLGAVLVRGCGPQQTSDVTARSTHIEDLTLKDIKKIAEEYAEAAEVFDRLLDKRLEPIRTELEKQGKQLQKIAEKVAAK